MKPYLFLYNIASCIGWAYVAYICITSKSEGKSAAELWEEVEMPLKIVQTAAILEVFHSLVGWVRSPVLTTFLQVSSRVVLLWGYTNACTLSSTHWSLYLMVTSWSLVEVPRYMFYSLNLYMKNVPFPIFWLRYSLFALLYPTGISGELLQMWTSLPYFRTAMPLYRIWTYIILLMYIPGGPFMYFHMVVQRKKSFKKRSEGDKPKRVLSGLVWPITDAKKDIRSTTSTNRAIWAAAAAGADAAEGKKIENERNWRFKYNKYVLRHATLCAKSEEDCLNVANAGLKKAYELFSFIKDGETVTLEQAMDGRFADTFETGFIKGEKSKPSEFEYEIPYNNGSTDRVLKGEEIIKVLNEWSDYGTIEPSCRDAIEYAVLNKKALDLSDKYFVLLGAGSAMGPLLVLMSLGANVIAIDLDRPGIWERLVKIARGSCGTMTFPLKKAEKSLKDDADLYANAGCNLFTQTPEIRNWIVSLYPKEPLTIGCYAYLDGALHVQVSLAMDAIVKGAIEGRKASVNLAYLCTPTDVHCITNQARDASITNFNAAPMWQKLTRAIFGKWVLKKNALKQIETAGEPVSLVDGLSVTQGPNYALAKRIQHWRAMVSWNSGCVVSTNIAPSTKTKSVLSNNMIKIAYEGMAYFKPMEIFFQETSNAVMGALLIHDICNPKSSANPKNKLDNPIRLFSMGSFHGGIWRGAFQIESIAEISALVHLTKTYFLSGSALSAAVAAAVYHVIQADLLP